MNLKSICLLQLKQFYVLNKLILDMHQECVQSSLSWQPITSSGYEYTHNILNEDP